MMAPYNLQNAVSWKHRESIVYLVNILSFSPQLTTAVNGARGMFDVSDAFMKTGMQQHRHRVAMRGRVKANCIRHMRLVRDAFASTSARKHSWRFRSIYILLCNSIKPLWRSSVNVRVLWNSLRDAQCTKFDVLFHQNIFPQIKLYLYIIHHIYIYIKAKE